MHGPQSVFDIGHCTVIHCDSGGVSLVDKSKAEILWYSFNWPITRCFLKPLKGWCDYRALNQNCIMNQHWQAMQLHKWWTNYGQEIRTKVVWVCLKIFWFSKDNLQGTRIEMKWIEKEEEVDRRRVVKTISKSGQGWTLPAQREQLRTGQEGGLWSHLRCPNDLAMLWDRLKLARLDSTFFRVFLWPNIIQLVFPYVSDSFLKELGPVVQSIVSLTSSLRGLLVKCFMTL